MSIVVSTKGSEVLLAINRVGVIDKADGEQKPNDSSDDCQPHAASLNLRLAERGKCDDKRA